MVKAAAAWNRPGSVFLILLVIALSSCCCKAFRPGGDAGVTLTSAGSVIMDDGSTTEEYELRESNPVLAHFVSLGSSAQKMLNKAGYAYGTLVGIEHSDRDEQYGERPDRAEWFPMVLSLEILEEDGDGRPEDVRVQYEVVLDYDPAIFAAPGLAMLEARKLNADGGTPVTLDVPPPKSTGFVDRNRKGITMMFGVIIASSIVKFLRRGMEALTRKAKQDGDEAEARDGDSASAEAEPSAETAVGKGSGNPKKKKRSSVKQD